MCFLGGPQLSSFNLICLMSVLIYVIMKMHIFVPIPDLNRSMYPVATVHYSFVLVIGVQTIFNVKKKRIYVSVSVSWTQQNNRRILLYLMLKHICFAYRSYYRYNNFYKTSQPLQLCRNLTNKLTKQILTNSFDVKFTLLNLITWLRTAEHSSRKRFIIIEIWLR